ncbi:MAG TPA: Ku protein [Ramlibacter sp.]|nr:Ku protein [Ramlibacter sp.]
MAEQKGMAKTSTRTLWKGAITFGLVHIPIGLYSATAESDLNFDWLDKRTMDRVGYKRVNKATGEEMKSENIVKGIEYEDGQYVVLTPEEISAAYPRTTQTIEIESFVDADEVPFVYLEKPYYIAPINKGEKVYALLREALKETHKVGIARVVIQTKQHLALLIPSGPALVLNLLRWGGEIRSWEDLKLPPATAKAAGVKEAELNMAKQLIEGMTSHWSADDFRDSFREEIMKLVEAKAKAGETEKVGTMESEPEAPSGATVIDLTELLRRSLRGGKASAAAEAPKAAPAKTPARATSAKTAAKTTRSARSREAEPARATASKEGKAASKPSTPRKRRAA